MTEKEHKILHGKHPRIRKVGELNSFYGKCHSEETKKRISESRKGKCVGKDNHNYGKTKSEEVRKKISQSKKGHIPWNKGKKMSESYKESCKKGWITRKNKSPRN